MADFLRIRPQFFPGLLRLSFSPRVSFPRLKPFGAATSVSRSGQRLKSYSRGSETTSHYGNSRDCSETNGFSLLQIAPRKTLQPSDKPYIPVFHPLNEDNYMIWSLFSKQNDGLLRHDDTAPGRVAFDGYFSQTGFSTVFLARQVFSDSPERLLFQLLGAKDDGERVIITRHRTTNVLVTELQTKDEDATDLRWCFEPEYFWSYTLFKHAVSGLYMASDSNGNATLTRMNDLRYPSPKNLFLLTDVDVEIQ